MTFVSVLRWFIKELIALPWCNGMGIDHIKLAVFNIESRALGKGVISKCLADRC